MITFSKIKASLIEDFYFVRWPKEQRLERDVDPVRRGHDFFIKCGVNRAGELQKSLY
jgi:hypothetical protein